jgi:hypothetical protein
MALAGVQQVVGSGLNPVYATPLSSEVIVPNDDLILHVKNASGGSMNVTLTDPSVTAAGSVSVNPVIAVPAAGERMIYLNPALMNPATGTIAVAFSATASITAALIRM